MRTAPQASYMSLQYVLALFISHHGNTIHLGLCIKQTMKGNIVLLGSTQALIKVPRHSDLRRCLATSLALCDILPDDDSSDGDWSKSGSSKGSSVRSHSASGDEINFGSPSASLIFRRKLPTRSIADGSSPIISEWGDIGSR